jgi:hypothetical protein
MTSDTTFAEHIEAKASAPIVGVVIGKFGWGTIDKLAADYEMFDLGERGVPPLPADKAGVVLPWSDARPFLDYEYDNGYGPPDCHAVFAWTDTHIVMVSQYDGSTRVFRVPRSPSPCEPFMPGG